MAQKVSPRHGAKSAAPWGGRNKNVPRGGRRCPRDFDSMGGNPRKVSRFALFAFFGVNLNARAGSIEDERERERQRRPPPHGYCPPSGGIAVGVHQLNEFQQREKHRRGSIGLGSTQSGEESQQKIPHPHGACASFSFSWRHCHGCAPTLSVRATKVVARDGPAGF